MTTNRIAPASSALFAPVIWTVAGVSCWLIYATIHATFRASASDVVAVGAAMTVTAAVWGSVLMAGMVLRHWSGIRRRWRMAIESPRALLTSQPDSTAERWTVGIIGGLILALTCYHLLIGLQVSRMSFRTCGLCLAVASGTTGIAFLLSAWRAWHVAFSEVGAGAMCLALACLGAVCTPDDTLTIRFPMMLNGVMVGLAIGAAWWCWLSRVWIQQLDQGQAWTTTGRMVIPATRVAFYSCALSLAAGTAMSVWPRLRGLGTMDHTLPRVGWGVAGHLLLIVVTVWCARRTGRSSFHGLAALALAGMLAFVFLRTVPLQTAAF